MVTCFIDHCKDEAKFVLFTFYDTLNYSFKTKTLVCGNHAMVLDDDVTISTKVVEYPIYRGTKRE